MYYVIGQFSGYLLVSRLGSGQWASPEEGPPPGVCTSHVTSP